MNKKTFLAIAGISMLSAFAGVAASQFLFENKEVTIIEKSVESPVKFVNNLSNTADIDFTHAAEITVDGVVHIKTKYVNQQQSQMDPFYQFFFGDGFGGNYPQKEQQASGSGVIISKDGYIVTNNHVVENSTEIEVVLNDKRSFEAQLIGRDPSTDLALLKITADDLTVVNIGNSDDVKVGQWVLAIGNPFNLTSTVTAGIVSAKARNINILDRSVGSIESFIQTDAAVNPGNSGGALVDLSGNLIGINTAIASQTGSFAGYAFAVPVTIVKKVVKDLMEFGVVQRALLGIHISDMTPEKARENDLSKPQGVFVEDVSKQSSAHEAGIKKGDIIIKVDGKEVNSVAQLQEKISAFRPGDSVQITYLRNGKQENCQVTFKSDKNSIASVSKNMSMLGASFEELSKSDLKKYGVSNGVLVADLKSGKLLSIGVKKGFVITHINQKAINSIEDIDKILSGVSGGVYIEGVYPNGSKAYYAFGM